MNATQQITWVKIWEDIKEIFRLSYDPYKDKDALPVRARTSISTLGLRTASSAATGNVHTDSTGKAYAKKTETNDSGQDVFAYDSTDVRTSVDNVPPRITDYDLYVYSEFKKLEKYKHMTIGKYRLIKIEGYCKAQDGVPLGYRKAALVSDIKKTRGCSDRYVNDYFKAMNIAQRMYLDKAPIEA